jgi:predicted ATPase
MENVYVKSIEAKGIYGRYDLKHEFKQGINIIFGKNGAGKTTLMHILANALNGEFDRFSYLEFKSIKIKLSDNTVLSIIYDKKSESVKAALNKVEIYPTYLGLECDSEFYRGVWSELTADDYDSIKYQYLLDENRSKQQEMVDEWIDDIMRGYNESVDDFYAIEEILKEYALSWIKDEIINPFSLPRISYFPAFRTMIDAWNISEDSENLKKADITGLARKHFGEFTPALNFPSLNSISENLENQISMAKERVLDTDRKLFSDAFLKVFTSLSDTSPLVENNEDLLDEIRGMLVMYERLPMGMKLAEQDDPNRKILKELFEVDQDDSEIGITSSSILQKLKEGIAKLHDSEGMLNNTANRILKIYLDVLKESAMAQRNAFSRIEDFKTSVNQFLENQKTFDYELKPLLSFWPKLGIRISDEKSFVRLETLSSGERQIFALLFATTEMYGTNIVLIDEPEISLHVDWQRRLLGKMAEHIRDGQIIVCTHSPVVAADFQDQMEEVKFRHRDYLRAKTSKPIQN